MSFSAEGAPVKSLLGLPLDEAVLALKQQEIAYDITEYSSLRGVEGANDKRVLRISFDEKGAHIIASSFLTEI